MKVITTRGTLKFLSLTLKICAESPRIPGYARERALILYDRIESSLEAGLDFFELGNEGADLESLNPVQYEMKEFKPLPTVWELRIREVHTASVPRKVIKADSLYKLWKETVNEKIPPGLFQWAGYASIGERAYIESTTFIYEMEVKPG